MSDPALRVNEERLRANMASLAAIGATPEGGIHRPALGEAHLEARRWFAARAARAGLEVRRDGAGNLSARLRCGRTGAKTLLLGSHLDSVPNGGAYDGALGVLCALEVLETVRDAGIDLPADLEAIDHTDEEGAYLGLLGSRALAGKLHASDFDRPHGGRTALEQALARAGLTVDGILSARRARDAIAGYLEVRIEQGVRLAEAGTEIGVVASIAGIRWYKLRFIGRADHAGTTPMALRRDAAQGASAFVLAVRETVMGSFEDCVGNVGRMDFAPGAYNVVPARVEVALELRAPDDARLERLDAALIERAHACAARSDLGLEVEPVEAIDPAPMDAAVQVRIAEAASVLGLTHTSLASGAGHDAQSYAGLCPVGMVFVPSVAGRSHSPQEFTGWRDCVNGANVLLQTVLRLGVVN